MRDLPDYVTEEARKRYVFECTEAYCKASCLLDGRREVQFGTPRFHSTHRVITQTYYCEQHRPKYGAFSLEPWTE